MLYSVRSSDPTQYLTFPTFFADISPPPSSVSLSSRLHIVRPPPVARPANWNAKRGRNNEIKVHGCRVDLNTITAEAGAELRRQVEVSNFAARNGCVAPSSLRTYATGMNSWYRCAYFYNCNAHCMDSCGRPLSVLECINSLNRYVGFECGLRQISPVSVKSVYIVGIAKTFDILGVINNFREASNHAMFKCLVDGYFRKWDQKHPAHTRVKIPFVPALARDTERLLESGKLQIAGHLTYGDSPIAVMSRLRAVTSELFGSWYLLRKNEFLPKVSTHDDHSSQMLRSHIRFLDIHQNVIPYRLLGVTRDHWLRIELEFSKADQSGHGRILMHYRQTSNPAGCVVTRMLQYIVMSRDVFGASERDPLFYVPGRPRFTTESLAAFMRATCHLIGLPASRVSAHSLRYGGATTMAAAGFHDYVIAYYGGWAPDSRCMRKYIKPSNNMVQTVSQHMASEKHSRSTVEIVNQLLAHRMSGSGEQARGIF